MEKIKRAATGRDSEKYIVRFPDGMRDRIAEVAKANNRSMNAEIIARLEASFATSGRETTIEEIKAMLIDRDRSLFEESVNAALERFKKELLDQK